MVSLVLTGHLRSPLFQGPQTPPRDRLKALFTTSQRSGHEKKLAGAQGEHRINRLGAPGAPERKPQGRRFVLWFGVMLCDPSRPIGHQQDPPKPDFGARALGPFDGVFGHHLPTPPLLKTQKTDAFVGASRKPFIFESVLGSEHAPQNGKKKGASPPPPMWRRIFQPKAPLEGPPRSRCYLGRESGSGLGHGPEIGATGRNRPRCSGVLSKRY